ncbi:MAG: hypothetical protein HQK56_18720 [Deltaproteobacteria bacterium]|nr:hypothetical protein [Deltaproteobacteria bacterium]
MLNPNFELPGILDLSPELQGLYLAFVEDCPYKITKSAIGLKGSGTDYASPFQSITLEPIDVTDTKNASSAYISSTLALFKTGKPFIIDSSTNVSEVMMLLMNSWLRFGPMVQGLLQISGDSTSPLNEGDQLVQIQGRVLRASSPQVKIKKASKELFIPDHLRYAYLNLMTASIHRHLVLTSSSFGIPPQGVVSDETLRAHFTILAMGLLNSSCEIEVVNG